MEGTRFGVFAVWGMPLPARRAHVTAGAPNSFTLDQDIVYYSDEMAGKGRAGALRMGCVHP